MEGIVFTIKRIIFHNDENGYTVVEGVNELNGNTFTAVCDNMLDPANGLKISAIGEWENSKHGKQFKFSSYKEEIIRSNQALIEYLGGGFFKGIGPASARKIVNCFHSNTIDIIENHPERLNEVKGLPKKSIKSLLDRWQEHKYILDIMLFLKEFKLTNNLIFKIYKIYGNNAISVIQKNPYVLVDTIDSVGFKKVDDIAINMGFDLYDEKRVYAGIKYVLNIMTEDGHTYLTNDELIIKSCEILNVENNVVESTLINLIEDHQLIKIDDKIFLPEYYRAETNIANKLLLLNNFKPYVTEHLPKTIEDIENENNFKFNDLQKKAINTALESNIMILTGGPGTGKTTVLKGIIQMLQSLDLFIGAAAPTGKASKRMTEVTGLYSQTIHRLLDYNPYQGFGYNEDNPLIYDVVIIDEISMVNVLLMNHLLNAIRPKTKLILVGDADQLPAIGPGNILSDCIESKIIPTICLKEIFRQAEDSEIILNAHAINNGKSININNGKPNNNFFFITRNNDDIIGDEIISLVTDRLPKKYKVKPTEIQVLSPMRKFTNVGSDELNRKLQTIINPIQDGVKVGQNIFKVGDKVMQIKNNYDKEIFNGDTGFITNVDTMERIVEVDYDGNKVIYDKSELDEIVLAYASTIHKSQGSEYPIVIIPVSNSHSRMLQRNLIYTAITRSKEICILIGQPNMLAYAINNTHYAKRNTYLKELLK